MNRDGDADVLVSLYEGVGWYENTDGLGTFGPLQIIDDHVSHFGTPADLDGDGALDVLVVQAWTDQEAVDKGLPQRYRVPKPSSPFDWLNPPPLDHTLIMQVWGFELSLLSVDGQPFWAYKLIH